ncbi:hypothetical protein HMPREF3158_03110 [Corynebacterium sp. HMSC06G04]|nr:hypothetical protein HMPREF3158_03110 [Corynebacterium sp. HMSC06G04]
MAAQWKRRCVPFLLTLCNRRTLGLLFMKQAEMPRLNWKLHHVKMKRGRRFLKIASVSVVCELVPVMDPILENRSPQLQRV